MNNAKWTPSFAWYKKVYSSIPEDQLIKMYEEQSGNKVNQNPKISFVIITARNNYPYIGRPDLYIFEPMIESLKNQTMKDFELIIVDTLYDERKDYFKDKDLPFKVKHVPASPNVWHNEGFPGICTQYNKGIIYADGELIFFTGESYMFVPEFCDRLWNHYNEGYIPLAWYFIDHTFSPDVVTASENQKIAYPVIESKLPDDISYNMSGYVGNKISIEHRPLLAFKNGEDVYKAPWEWFFGCSSAPIEAMLKINGFDQRFDGDRSLLDCDVGSRLELAGFNNFALFKDSFIIRLPTDTHTWNTKLPKDDITIKCNLPLIHWSRNSNHYVANDHQNIDEDIKWCKEEYCAKQCQIRELCKKDHPWQYPFEHTFNEVYKCKAEKKWFDFWRTHQIKINLAEERKKRIVGDEKYKEGTFV